MDKMTQAAPLTQDDAGTVQPPTLAEVRAMHPQWSIWRVGGGGLFCQGGAWRFPAVDPEDAHRGIVTRETPWR